MSDHKPVVSWQDPPPDLNDECCTCAIDGKPQDIVYLSVNRRVILDLLDCVCFCSKERVWCSPALNCRCFEITLLWSATFNKDKLNWICACVFVMPNVSNCCERIRNKNLASSKQVHLVSVGDISEQKPLLFSMLIPTQWQQLDTKTLQDFAGTSWMHWALPLAILCISCLTCPDTVAL